MKLKLTLIATLISVILLGQNNEWNYNYDWEYYSAFYQPIHFTNYGEAPDVNVEQLHYILINKKGKKTNYYKEFNSNGKLLKYYKKEADNVIIPLVEFVYDSNNVKVAKSFKKGIIKYTTENKWNNYNRLLETKKNNRKGETTIKNTWEYSSDSCTISSTYQKNGKIKRKWEYEYYKKCDKSCSKLYNGKGKLLNVWTYDCNQEGEKLTAKSDTTQVCKWDEVTSDFLIKVYQTFDEKGKVLKHVSKYTRLDTSIVESTTYDKNENILYHSTYNKSFQKPLISEGFRKGKKTYHYEYQYNNDKVISYTYSYNNKLRSKYENKYEEGRFVEQKRYNKKGELLLTIQLEYGKSFAKN